MKLCVALVFLVKAVFCTALDECTKHSCYTLQTHEADFDESSRVCGKTGSLTDMASALENERILQLVSRSLSSSGEFDFWIGLSKAKTDCVQRHLPLRGFNWTALNRADSDVSQWKKEPMDTCTSHLCAVLSVDVSDSKVDTWGWKQERCKVKHGFICKLKMCKTLQIPGEKEIKHNNPYGSNVATPLNLPSGSSADVTCLSGSKVNLQCSGGEWQLTSGEVPDLSQICRSPNCLRWDAAGRKCVKCDGRRGFILDGDGKSCISVGVSNTASNPVLEERATTKRDDVNGRMRMETSTPSSHQLLSERNPAPTSAAILTSKAHSNNSEVTRTQSNVLIPVLVGVVVLVVLVVILVGVFKCCFRKRSKKKAHKKGKRSNSVDLSPDNADSVEHTNEKDGLAG